MASQGGDKVEIIDTLDAGYYSSYYQDESFQQNENWPAAFAIYLAFFLTLIILAFLLDYSGYFDQYISKKVWKSHENLMEGIFLRRIANSVSSPNPSFSQKYNDKLDEFRAQRMSNTDIEHGNVISSERTISVDPRQDRISNVSSHNGNTENNTVITNPVYRYCCCLCSHWMKGKEKLSEEYFTDLLERPAFLATVDRQDMLQDDGSNFFSKELLVSYYYNLF